MHTFCYVPRRVLVCIARARVSVCFFMHALPLDVALKMFPCLAPAPAPPCLQHQPSLEVFEAFDMLVLLQVGGGRLAYQG